MPIKVPDTLPALETLRAERVPLITSDVAIRQDIRPMRVAILNLMPDKIRTETQLLRVLGATPLQVEVTLLNTASYESKNTAKEHLSAFYKTHADIKDERFDALIVTGAPVEQMPFEHVEYWPELQSIFEWAKTHVYQSLFICWGAQAALYHHHGIDKYEVPHKLFGIIKHKVVKPYTALTNGFDDVFGVPVSRHTDVKREDIQAVAGLEILLDSAETGVCLVQEEAARRTYMFNHLEYESDTLRNEYERDLKAGLNPNIPPNYFPDDDPAQTPRITWRAHRNLFFSNWLNMVYQGTPYDLGEL